MNQNNSLLIDANQVASILNISRSLFYSLRSTGKFGPQPVRLGRRTLWRAEELKRWIDAGCPPRHQWIKK